MDSPVKPGDKKRYEKDRFDKEQIDVKEAFPVTIPGPFCQFK